MFRILRFPESYLHHPGVPISSVSKRIRVGHDKYILFDRSVVEVLLALSHARCKESYKELLQAAQMVYLV